MEASYRPSAAPVSRKPIFRILSAFLLLSLLLSQPAQPAVQASSSNLAGPTGSSKFGLGVYVLPNGNFVVTDPFYSPGSQVNIGAVYLYDGVTRNQIVRLSGSTNEDQVGSGGIQILADGSFVVVSPRWNYGAVTHTGAVTWIPAAGCANPASGCTNLTISTANSLVGDHSDDQIGSPSTLNDFPMTDSKGIQAVSGSAYLVRSSFWNGERGAVTYCSEGGATCLGVVSSSNSLVGATAGDKIGSSIVDVVPSGGYIVHSTTWHNGSLASAGAVTPCPASGCTGVVSTANSLYGESTDDKVGTSVNLLPGNGFVVRSPLWNSTYNDVGAVAFCASVTDPKCIGKPVSTQNSLLGAAEISDILIGFGETTVLPDGGYLVLSPSWNKRTVTGGTTTDTRTGALTYCSVSGSGDSQTSSCTGQTVTAANSLTGDVADDNIGSGVRLLKDGAFVTFSDSWHNSTGAVTYCSSASACMGQVVSSSNSLVGGNAGDPISNPTGGDHLSRDGGVLVLSSGKYVVFSPLWDPAGQNNNKGAVTFCESTGCTGLVSPANSLTGLKNGDKVGLASGFELSSGAIVILSPFWDNGAVTDAGAVTFCASADACKGATVELSNSLVSDYSDGNVGFSSYLPFSNGSYLIGSPDWNNGSATHAGALTWCPASGCTNMTISSANSLVGSVEWDYLGDKMEDVGDGLYVTRSPSWQNGFYPGAGAVSLCRQSAGCSGSPAASNSVLGSVNGYNNGGYYNSLNSYDYDTLRHRLLVGLPMENKVVFFTIAQTPGASTAAASNVSTTGATLNGAVNPNLGNTTITFEYGPTTAYGSSAPASQSPLFGETSTPASAAISGLTPGATYHYRIVAANEANTTYGSDQTFATLVASMTISGNAGTGEATLTYTGGSTTAASNGSYSITVANGWSGSVTPGKSGYTFDPPSRTYTSITANQTSQDYQAAYTPPQVQAASDALVNGFTANWSACPGAVTYFFDLATDASFTHFVSGYQNRDVGTVTSLAVSGLDSDADYYYRVRASDGALTSASSSTAQIHLFTSAVTISGNTGTGGVTLTYTGGSIQSAGDGSYSFTVASGWSGTVTPGKNGYTFDPPSRTYSSVSANQTGQDYQVAYTPPQIQPTTNVTAGGFTANWSACPGAVTYYLDLATDPAFTQFVPGYQNRDIGLATSLAITGLNNGVTYYYRVRASDGTLTGTSLDNGQITTPWMVYLPVTSK